ncbi:MAG: hypothetical protein ACRD0F_07570, partial [Acidimicrobiales bacterium]
MQHQVETGQPARLVLSLPPPGLARRETRVLFACAALASTGLFSSFTVSPLLATEIGGSRAWSGVPAAAGIAGTAVGAVVVSRAMARWGRGPGLRLGYSLALAGAAAAVVGARWLAVVVAGMALIGL